MAGRDIPLGPWHIEPELWGKISLAGKVLPGVATITGLKRANRFDEKKAKGKSGSKDEFLGVDPAEMTIEIRFWTAEQWETIKKDHLADIMPNTEKEKLDSIAASHALLIAFKIDLIIIKSVSAPVKAEDGIYSMTIEAKEYRKPSAKNATGTMGGGRTKSLGLAGDCGALVIQRQQLQADLQAMKGSLAGLMLQDAVDGGTANKAKNSSQKSNLSEANALVDGFNASSLKNQIEILQGNILTIESDLRAIADRQRALGCDSRSPDEPNDPAPPPPEPSDPPPEPEEPFPSNPEWF